jgi:acyl phosphate:glycerol-3-phosphate acyltransferase
MSTALLLAGSYLLGSISFSLLLVWLLERVDLRTLGSGNPGATNVLRTSGRWPALVVLLLDIAKGLVPVALARRLGGDGELQAGAALAAIAGHVFPVFFGFRGGKGVATGFGAFAALFPAAAIAALLLFVFVVATTRYVSVGSIVAALAVPPLALGAARLGWSPDLTRLELGLVVIASLLVAARHWTNVRRLLAGSERRLGGGIAA